MIELALCVNDKHGNVTEYCDYIDVIIDDECIMSLESSDGGLLDFSLLDGAIKIGNWTLKYDRRTEYCGNIFWNNYHVFAEDVAPFLNGLHSAGYRIVEGREAFFDRWESGQPFDVEFLNQADVGA